MTITINSGKKRVIAIDDDLNAAGGDSRGEPFSSLGRNRPSTPCSQFWPKAPDPMTAVEWHENKKKQDSQENLDHTLDQDQNLSHQEVGEMQVII